MLDAVRLLCRILQHLNTSSDDYSVVFVSSCTAGLKLVADNFQFVEPSSTQPRDCDLDDVVEKFNCVTRATVNAGCPTERKADDFLTTESVDTVECDKVLHRGSVEGHRDFCSAWKVERFDEQNARHFGEEFPAEVRRGDEIFRRESSEKRCNRKVLSESMRHVCVNPNVDGDGACTQSDPQMRSCEWNSESMLKPTFLYLDDNHTSLIGMRTVVAHRGTQFRCIQPDEMDRFLSSLQHCGVKRSPASNQTPHQCHLLRTANSLFAYPAQSNFSGFRYPLEWVDAIRRRSERGSSFAESETFPARCEFRTRPPHDGECRMRPPHDDEYRTRPPHDGEFRTRPVEWYVLLDAAALLTTSTLNLGRHKPDFVVLSFYKMFGFPTGLGLSVCSDIQQDVM